MAGSLRRGIEKAKKERAMAAAAQGAAKIKAPAEIRTPVGPAYRDVQRVTLDTDTILANRCVCANSDVLESDYYKVLRTQIQHVVAEKRWRAIMVTSTLPDEGKTLTSINLAFSFAKAYDQTVMLIDADLKNQQVHKTLGIHSQYGLVDYLINDQPISDCLIRPEGEKLVLISGGRSMDGSSELLGSQVMRTFVRETRDRYEDRLVFFDVPPIMIGADAMAFAPLVDGIVFVVRAGQTSTKQARKAIELLPQDKLIGVVLNGQKMNADPYKKYYKKISADVGRA
ncbi:MAG: polysaccharide biosynthesis tyrosine autokinase [Desulfobacteraceae bacterium]